MEEGVRESKGQAGLWSTPSLMAFERKSDKGADRDCCDGDCNRINQLVSTAQLWL